MTSATNVPDSAGLKANAIYSSVKCFFPIHKTTLSGDAKVKKPNIPDGSRNGDNVILSQPFRRHICGFKCSLKMTGGQAPITGRLCAPPDTLTNLTLMRALRIVARRVRRSTPWRITDYLPDVRLRTSHHELCSVKHAVRLG
jgi:hypothetical protein